MKYAYFKISAIFPILLTYLILINDPIFSQTNSNTVKESNLRFERLIVNLRTTVEEEITRLDNINNNYLTKLSGLVSYDRVYLSKASEKQFFSKGALDSLRMPKMNRELKCLSEAP